MTIERNVILDLLPLYFSDEASPETRALVDDHLARDPDLARLAEQWKLRLPQQPPPPVRADAEAEAYKRAQQKITNRIVIAGIGIATGLLVLGGAVFLGALFLMRS